MSRHDERRPTEPDAALWADVAEAASHASPSEHPNCRADWRRAAADGGAGGGASGQRWVDPHAVAHADPPSHAD